MKRGLLLFCALIISYLVSAQTVVFHENFEQPTPGDSVTSTSTPSGANQWTISTSLASSGTRSMFTQAVSNSTVYLTTDTFSTIGNSYVILQFAQICKQFITDGGQIEVWSGSNWVLVTAANYLGTGQMALNKFSENSYATDWQASNPTAVPDNSWWKTEQFDLSSLIANKPQVAIRFKLQDGGTPGAEGRYGWLIDDVNVIMSPSELIPPTLNMSVYPQDTVYSQGPFNVKAYANDASGIDTVYLQYKVGNGPLVHLGMTKNASVDSLYEATIPAITGWGKLVTYKVYAVDNTTAQNTTAKPNVGNFWFFCKYANGGLITVGTGTTLNGSTGYPSTYGLHYTGNKEQYLIRASELQALGASGGAISNIAFDVVTPAGPSSSGSVPSNTYCQNFSIKVGTTASSALTASWITGLTQVYTNPDYVNIAGWNNHPFASNFNWDGVSNLVIEVCFDKYVSGSDYSSANAILNQTTTAYVSTNNYHTDAATLACPSSTSSGTYSQRPNMKITILGASALTQDAGISQIVNPIGGVQAGSQIPIQAKIKNFGTSLLTKAQILYSIDGGTPVTTPWNGPALANGTESGVLSLGNQVFAVGPHTLKIWSELPNDSVDQNSINDTAVLAFSACVSTISGTKTIGAGGDYANITEAITGILQCGLGGPVVFNILPGTYSDQIILPEIPGTSATNTITFQSANNDYNSVIFNRPSTTASNFILKFDGADYITFRKVKFAPSDSINSTSIVFGANSNNNIIEENFIKGFLGSAESQVGIRIDNASNIDNVIKGNRFEGGYAAVFCKGTSSTKVTNITLKNNIINQWVKYGIYAQYSKYISIDSNVVASTYQASDKYGIYVQYTNDHVSITRNSINVNAGTNMYGILFENCTATTAERNLCANNFVTIFNGTNYAYGIRVNTSTYHNVLFNTVIVNGANTTDTRAINIVSSSSNNQLYNNNLQSNWYPLHVEGTSVTACDYNNYYATGTAFAKWNTTDYPNLTALRNATQKDSNSFAVNPYFMSSNNVHIYNTVLYRVGKPFAGIVDIDIDGDPRSNPPCIGADEFPLPPYDITFVSMLQPTTGCGLTQETVKVVLKNTGVNTITTGTCSVGYGFVNSANSLVNIITPEVINRNIAPNDTIHYSFNTKANLNVSAYQKDSTYKLRAWGILPGDYIPVNDTGNISLISKFQPLAPQTSTVNIAYASPATLVATSVSNTPLYWFENPIGGTSIYNGNTYTLPIQYISDTFFVEANTTPALIKITEVIQNKFGTGSTNPYPSWINGNQSSDFDGLELTNLGVDVINLAGYTMQFYSTDLSNGVNGTYTFLPNTIVLPNQTVVLDIKSTIGDNAQNKYFVCSMTGNPAISTAQAYILKNPNGVVVDVVGLNSIVIPASTGVTASDWTGTISPASGAAGVIRTIYDSNSGTDWVTSSASAIQSLGQKNSQLTSNGNIYNGCVSNRSLAIMNVGAQPTKDAGVIAINNPNTGTYLSTLESITVVVKNFGSTNISNFPVKYRINNNTVVTETFTSILKPDSVATYTFIQKADLSTMGAYTVKAFTSLTTDANALNDTTSKTVVNGFPGYCLSYATNTIHTDIVSVNVGGVINTSTCSTTGGQGSLLNRYSSYLGSAPINLDQGMPYSLSVDVANCDTNNNQSAVKVYIDFNRNGSFADAGEQVYVSTASTLGAHTESGSFVTPLGIQPGFSVMRVVLVETTTPSSILPCNSYSYGETEDYLIRIMPPAPKDAGVISIVRPSAIENEGASIPVKVVIKNFGSDTIKSVTGLVVRYAVNGGTPVSYNYTGTLPFLASDTVILPNMIAPRANASICAYTVLAGDNNTQNDQTCKNFYGNPMYDAMLSRINPIQTGCSLGMDTVKIMIRNLGTQQMNGGLVAKYKIAGTNTLISEVVPNAINAGDSLLYKFNTLIDLSNSTSFDKLIKIEASVKHALDSMPITNDTLSYSLVSMSTPVAPIVTNVTYPYASPVTLNVTPVNNVPVYWYMTPTITNHFNIGSTYVLPIQYVSDTFWIASKTGSSLAATIGTGTSTQNYPFYTNWGYTRSASLYTASEIGANGAINQLQWNVTTSSTLNVPIKIYLKTTTASSMTADTWANLTSGAVLVYDGIKTFGTTGWTAVTFTTPYNYTSGNLMVLCEANVGGGGASPIPVFQYTTTTASGSHQYQYQDNTPPSGTLSLNTSRPNIKIIGNIPGCTSAKIPLIMTITAQPLNDASCTQITAPASGGNLSSNETVTVKVKNYGSAPIQGIKLNYQLDNNPVVTENFPDSTINAGDTKNFTFTQKANLNSPGQTYSMICYPTLLADVNQYNDTVRKNVTNYLPIYCTSAASNTTNEDLTRVKIGSLNNFSVPTGNKYTDFSSAVTPPSLIMGVPYPISISSAKVGSSLNQNDCWVNVFVDLDRNGVFDTITERVFGDSTKSQNTVFGTVTIPQSAQLGLLKMRVVLRQDGVRSNTGPCGNYLYGETEDYLIRTVNPIPNDAGIADVIKPEKFMPNTAIPNVQPKVVIANYGTNPMAAVVINYTVNGIVYSYNWTKTPALPSLSTDTVTLPTLTLNKGLNEFQFVTSLAGDINYSNDSMSAKCFREVLTTPEYVDNFEVNKYWYAIDTAFGVYIDNLWQQGVPASSVINAAHSPSNVWKTVLNGNVDDNNTSVLYTPIFNITVMTADTLKFWHWRQLGSSKARIEYLNSAGNWITLGSSIADTNAYNWYSDPLGWTGNGTGWEQSWYVIKNLQNLNGYAQFRFIFTSGSGASTSNGWALDDVKVSLVPIPKDAGVIAIQTPGAQNNVGDNVTPKVTIKNFGTDVLTSIPVAYSINGGAPVVENWTGNLVPGATTDYTFASPFVVQTQDYNICAYTTLASDIYTSNDKTCKDVDVVPAANDVGVIRILVPGDTAVIFTQVFVKIRIKNFGTNQVSSIPVAYKRGSSTAVVETWTGSPLAYGDSTEYQFTQPFTVPSGSSFNISAYTSLVADVYAPNDKITKNIIIGVEDAMTDDGLILSQNIPNPASESTIIGYSLPKYGKVKFNVVNTLGQTIYSEEISKEAGCHQFNLDVKNMPNGVYYYSIEYKGQLLVKKMTITK